jgi:hypothetical protein
MGDRGNIVIETEDKKPLLFFYTHWTGSDLPEIVADGLEKGKPRWGHDAYLNRILFSNLVGEDNWDDETGYGISTTECDGGTEVYICHDPQRVRFAGRKYTFEEFIAWQRGPEPGQPDEDVDADA